MKDILAKKKLVFKYSDINLSNVPLCKELSIERVLAIAYQSEKVKMYLPDEEDVSAKRMNRDYLFNILNTIDPLFFKSAIREVEGMRNSQILKEED